MKPNEYVVLFSVLLAGVLSKHIQEVTGLRAVSDFPVMEEYFYSLHTENFARPPLERSSSLRRALCKKIFTSPFFEMHQQEWINVEDRSIKKMLFDDHRDVFFSIFKQHHGRHVYKNPYKTYPFHYDGEWGGEDMFICLVRKIISRKIKLYLVSRVYNVNLISGGSPIAGRFIFTFDRSDLVVRALAEESAVESSIKHEVKVAEYRYMKHRQKMGIIGASEVDPICCLTASNKLRLCTSIFASKVLRRKYKFSPTLRNVELECQKREISFFKRRRAKILTQLRHPQFKPNRVHEEWTIGCTAERIASPETVTYYVSKGKVRNTVFVYKKRLSDNGLYVVDYFKNVSVVGSDTSDEDEVSDGEESFGTNNSTIYYSPGEDET